MFEGLGTAIITPFKKGEVDLDAYNKLLDYQVSNGVKNIIVCGTTGEATTLSNEEQISLISNTVKFCKGKNVKVVAGASSSNTKVSIELAQRNKELGVDGVLIAVPPYNKPMQNGMYLHYKTIAEEVKVPIILYNVPGRTSRDMTNDTIAKLSKLDYIVALKDATGDLSRVADLRIKVNKDFTMLSGEDATAVGIRAKNILKNKPKSSIIEIRDVKGRKRKIGPPSMGSPIGNVSVMMVENSLDGNDIYMAINRHIHPC